MPRAVWKGAITFGLVHVPVAMYPATHEEDIDFDWLDARTLDPVGYKRINKRTGREIDKAHIVKGIRQESGDYVVLSDTEIRAAYPKTTQTIEIQCFVRAQEVAFVYLERPYYLEPAGRGGEKVYALLREAMTRAGVIGIARLVMHTKEHLAALIPTGPALMLETLRWVNEVRSAAELALPPAGGSAFKAAELTMAGELIAGMTGPWKPGEHADAFTAAIRTLAAKKVQAGEAHAVEPLEEAPAEAAQGKVIDLADLLRQSLAARKSPAQAAARKRTTAPRRKRA